MPLTRPIPAEAMPVVEILRRDVKRPGKLPKTAGSTCYLRFDIVRSPPDPTWMATGCPIGLHRSVCSLNPTPTHAAKSLGLDYVGPMHFIDWWDEQTDPQAATDAVWPVNG